jgi:hypothetical protein
MSLEAVNTIASIGTLLVIAATAIAAIAQLRHMRGSNQIVALTECREVLESEPFARAMRYISHELPELMKDPQVRARLMKAPVDEELRAVNVVGNFFESMGSFVKHGIIDAEIACDLWSGIVVQSWNSLTPVLGVMRRSTGAALWENFEYLASLSEEWVAKNPNGAYPAARPHLVVEDVWRAADEAAGIYQRQ